MDSGNPNAMPAQQRRSLSRLGIRDPASSEERVHEQERSHQVEEQAEEWFRQPPMIKLRGRELSLADYIRERRVRASVPSCAAT